MSEPKQQTQPETPPQFHKYMTMSEYKAWLDYTFRMLRIEMEENGEKSD